ncbi:GNAT family N-acetyltransferase [Cognatishimia sp. SS12]|uniref:GNAT family N-acetyltransferase n=1 Tax=Cognatishimia sp. SS12 TaxID=2979465 RepID=UPI00232ADD1E|nr:GNAT family N-acetyltransferase [Cognatishimia sp. SS12]MDC0738953.1 GNAT family N-acetyltransferase [Cognatishimia sp. SS12]
MIRAAAPEDAEAISRLLIASITELCSADHQNDPAHLAHWTRGKCASDVRSWMATGTELRVSEQDHALCAVGAYRRNGEILLLYVAPGAQGQGHSAALLKAMERELVALGCTEAQLVSSRTAQGFYERRGWQISGARVACYSTDGQPMTKTLCAPPPA